MKNYSLLEKRYLTPYNAAIKDAWSEMKFESFEFDGLGEYPFAKYYIFILFFFPPFSKWLFSHTLSNTTIQAENTQYFFSIMTNFFNHLLQWRKLGKKKTNRLCTICTSRSYVQNETGGWLLRRSFCSQHPSPLVTCTHTPPVLLRGTILLPLLL